MHRTSRRESTNGNFQLSATPSCWFFFCFFFKCIIVHGQKFWVILLVRRAKSFAFYSPVNTGLEIEASTVQQGPFLLQSVISLRSGIKKKRWRGRGDHSQQPSLSRCCSLWDESRARGGSTRRRLNERHDAGDHTVGPDKLSCSAAGRTAPRRFPAPQFGICALSCATHAQSECRGECCRGE